MRLGVNDKLTEIKAVSVKGTYYVPLRDLSTELNLTLTGQSDGIEVKGPKGYVKLSLNEGGSVTSNGIVFSLNTFNQDGKRMVPLKVVVHLGYIISYKPEQYLLRVHDDTAQLDNAAFVNKYQEELMAIKEPVPTPQSDKRKSGQVVYLTFDDGPTVVTGQLLDLLAKYDVKATFFMMGPHINKYPDQVKRIAKEKHGMGLHGITHRKERFYASPAAALAEMKGDQAILKKVTGISSILIRTPYGSKPYFTKSFRDKVLSQDFNLWDWNVDSEDWKYKEDSAKIYNSVMNQVHKLQKGKVNPVILMHDQKSTLKVLPQILESLKKEGYQFEIITKDLKPLNFWKDLR
ncbi:polysaccharide deacetylase family protein [Paenibacillus wynnii]|uniref:polysaccharide deacetylase family protein n=1 Tax=Paenibacillus wynnii TaxID=268407 RepID=UPI001470612E|nr:polysaccharide deacetylase family protein [Paenibacillus wynnii]